MTQRILTTICCILAGSFLKADTINYTAAEDVDTVLSGDTSIKVSCPQYDFVSLTQHNTFTGGTELISGGVIISNVCALGSGPITCHSGTTIKIMVSFREAGKDLKTDLLDRLTVIDTEKEEPWVSIQVAGEGLRNDIDFTGQPYLWLGTPQRRDWQPVCLDGTFEPCGNIYRFGHNATREGGQFGLRVPRISDAPDGTPRKVICRGPGAVTFDSYSPNSSPTWTGGTIAEEKILCTFFTDRDLGTLPPTVKRDHLLARSGARIVFGSAETTYGETFGITVDGEVDIHICGAKRRVVSHFLGPISGQGTIRLTDQGCISLESAENTFTGAITLPNRQRSYWVDVIIGNGENFSWKGSSIQTDLTNQRIILNSAHDVQLDTRLTATGQLIKRGSGTITLSQPLQILKPFSDPCLRIENGTLRFGSTENTLPETSIFLGPDAFLDLNGFPFTSLPLLLGSGSLTNVTASPLLLTGYSPTNESFHGKINQDVTIRNQDFSQPWFLSSGAEFTGDVNLEEGDIAIGEGSLFRGALTIAPTATVSFPPSDMYTKGLTLKYWTNLVNAWTDIQDHPQCLRDLIDRFSRMPPDILTDTRLFGDYLKSGNNNNDEGTVGQPFANSLGGTQDNFGAEFSGYFIAEQEGDYTFQVTQADDGVAIYLGDPLEEIIFTCGKVSEPKTLHLAKGYHPIRVYFSENWGWEVMHVKVKCPGDEKMGFLPIRLLSTWNGEKSTIASLEGSGKLVLEENSNWPEIIDSSRFSGLIQANSATDSPDAGALPLHQADIQFGNPWSTTGDRWSFYGTAMPYTDNASSAIRLVEGKSMCSGSINSRERIPLNTPWRFEFDFQAIPPFGEDVGDGFSLVLHDSGTTGHNNSFANENWDPRIEDRTSYGMQLYLMPWQSQFTWIERGFIDKRLDGVVTNRVYTMASCKDRPMHVALSYDGTANLAVTVSRTGDPTWTSTNTFAGADFAERFPNGAYLGVWGRCGGFFTGMKLSDLRLSHDGLPSSDQPSYLLSHPLELRGGTITLKAEGQVDSILSTPLMISGPAVIHKDPERPFPLAITGESWTFDLDNPSALLRMTGGDYSFGEKPILIELLGEVPPKSRVLADLTGMTSPAQPTFALGTGAPRGTELTFTDGLLTIKKSVGTLLLLQ